MNRKGFLKRIAGAVGMLAMQFSVCDEKDFPLGYAKMPIRNHLSIFDWKEMNSQPSRHER